MKVNDVVIGKRVTVGAAITQAAAIFAYYLPDHAPAIVSGAGVLTFVVQVLIARYGGVTQ